MNFRVSYIIPVLFIAGLFSCKKDIPPTAPDSDPVFSYIGLADGVSKNFIAGENDYYMYANVYQDGNGVNVFDSHLKKFECTSCSEDLQIIIKDYQTSSVSDPIIFSNSIDTGYYAYEIPGGAPISYTVNFIVNTNPAVASSYYWDFGDGSSQTAAPGPIAHTYSNPGKYEACLTVTFPSSATSTICQVVNIEIPDNSCKFVFSNTSSSGTTVDFTSNYFTGTAPFNYSWNFGDGNSSTLQNPSHTYSAAGSYLVCLQVTDANGAVSKFCKNVNTLGAMVPIANMDHAITGSTPNPNSFSNVTINYTDENGTIWTTYNTSGQNLAFFKITEIEDYLDNESGFKTKKITLDFKCRVYNGTNYFDLTQSHAVFAFAYHD
jgi:PKD repeat protein